MPRRLFVALLVLPIAVIAFVWAHPLGTRTISVEQGVRSIVRRVKPAPAKARLLFVGDIMLSRSVGDLMTQKGDWHWSFRLTASASSGYDFAFANLESMVSARGSQRGCGYCFRADPRAVAGLADAGFDAVSVANNHAWDYGPEAFTDTVALLADGGIAAVGAGRDPVFRTVNATTIALLAFTDLLPASACALVNCYDAARITEDILRARQAADVVVVSFHGGEEYVPATEQQKQRYRSAIDAGADIIVGHHPHVVQETERYGDGFIAYSLGNYIFDQNWSAETRRGMALDVLVEAGRISGIATRSVQISTQYQPRFQVVTPPSAQ